MPDTLWEIFSYNRSLLGLLFNCSAQILILWAKKKGIDIGMFCALHTYGRQLNWNTHIHLFVTRVGVCLKLVYENLPISKQKTQKLIGNTNRYIKKSLKQS